MALYKRGSIWWFRHGSVRESTHTDDRHTAGEYEARRVHELWREKALGESPGPTLAEAIADWVAGHAIHKRSYADDWLRLQAMEAFIPDIRVAAVKTATLAEIRNKVVASRTIGKAKRPIKPATANRYLAILSAVLNRCHELDIIKAVPAIPYQDEPDGKLDFLTRQQAVALINEAPAHLSRMIRFSLATGLRDANMRGLEWSKINLATRTAWVQAEDAKGKRAISIPLNEDAVRVLRECFGHHKERVFVYEGNPITQGAGNSAFRKAKARAGVPHITWHTLRHSWASWHIQRGTSLKTLQELGGWSSIDMVLRYAHLAPGHAAAFAENSVQNWHTDGAGTEGETEGNAFVISGVADGVRTHDNRNHNPVATVKSLINQRPSKKKAA